MLAQLSTGRISLTCIMVIVTEIRNGKSQNVSVFLVPKDKTKFLNIAAFMGQLTGFSNPSFADWLTFLSVVVTR